MRGFMGSSFDVTSSKCTTSPWSSATLLQKIRYVEAELQKSGKFLADIFFTWVSFSLWCDERYFHEFTFHKVYIKPLKLYNMPTGNQVGSLLCKFHLVFHAMKGVLYILIIVSFVREIHSLDPQPHRHSMLVPRVCAPRVTRSSLGKYWSHDWFRDNFSLP